MAQAFERALIRQAAIGASFHVAAEQAMTCRGLAVGVAAWFGREAVLDLVERSEFERRVGSEHAATTLDHIDRSIAAGIDRARSMLGYAPRYSSLEALRESLRWLVEHGQADVAGLTFLNSVASLWDAVEVDRAVAPGGAWLSADLSRRSEAMTTAPRRRRRRARSRSRCRVPRGV